MILKNLLHIHVPRTGGQFLRGILGNEMRDFGIVPLDEITHQSASELRQRLGAIAGTEAAKAARTMVVVRNPWDWYVSRYFFRLQRDKGKKKPLPIDECGESPEGFRRHLWMLDEALFSGTDILDKDGNPAESDDFRPITLSEWHNRLADEPLDIVARFETLAADLSHSLAPILGVPEQVLKERLGASKANISVHPHYKSLYDDSSQSLVERWEAQYISRFGYKF